MRKYFEFLITSPNLSPKKCMNVSVENLYVDIEV